MVVTALINVFHPPPNSHPSTSYAQVPPIPSVLITARLWKRMIATALNAESNTVGWKIPSRMLPLKKIKPLKIEFTSELCYLKPASHHMYGFAETQNSTGIIWPLSLQEDISICEYSNRGCIQ